MNSTEKQDIKVIGLVCERSVDLDDRLDEQGCLKDDPGVKIIRVPCSGIIQPLMFETALKKGAEGCFATGCRIGDCHYREGNKFLKERLEGTRMPKIKPNIDKQRIQAYWLSALEYEKFKSLVEEFVDHIDSLDPVNTAVPSKTAVSKS